MDVPAGVVAFHALVVLVLVARWARRRRPRAAASLDTPADHAGDATGTISVVVPMRNEAHNVARCVGSLVLLRGSVLDIVVVDDHSRDDTFERISRLAAGDGRIRLLRGRDVPAPWVAKNFALQQGAGVARGEWLLFVDADVALHPDAAACAVAYAESRGLGLLSLSPRQECDGFWERAIQPLVFAMLSERYDMGAVNDPSSPLAAANGQFMLVRRSVYDAVGGHAAVRDRVLEDVAFAEAVKRRGMRLFFANTRTLASTRMYDGFRPLWLGWSKNLFPLLGGAQAPAWWAIVFHLGICALAGVTGAVAVGGLVLGDLRWTWPALSGAAALAVLAVLERRAEVAIGPRWAHPAVSPLAHAVFALMIFNSWYWHTVRRRVWWSGRSYRYHQDEVRT